MNKNKGFGIVSVLIIIILILMVGVLGYWFGKKSITENESIINNSLLTNNLQNKNIYECPNWLVYKGAYSVNYPECWLAFDIKGGSIGSSNSNVGISLKPALSSDSNDEITIGGWQYDCSDVNVSGETNSALRTKVTKAYCLKPENGEKWEGEYITEINQGKIHGIPVVTHSANPDLLKMFDLIIIKNR